MKAIAYGAALCGAIALGTPLSGRDAGQIHHWYGHAIAAAVDDSDELLFPNFGATSPPNDSTQRAADSNWLKFETDGCGIPTRADSKRSMLTQTADDDADDDAGVDDGDPVDESWAIIGKWLSEHPDIAVISDGVEKSCDDDSIDDANDVDGPEFIADWRIQVPRRLGTPRSVAYIA